MKKSTTRIAIIIICLIAVLVGYYAYLSNKSRESRKEPVITAAQRILSRDLTIDYPSTPKEVIKYYNDILRCFYGEECTDTEIDDLGIKARELYDEELLEINELGSYLIRLKSDIVDYQEKKRKMTSASVASSTNVFYFEEDGYEFARIGSGYTIMDAGQSRSTTLIYLLRKNSDKQWKIYGWTTSDNLNINSEES